MSAQLVGKVPGSPTAMGSPAAGLPIVTVPLDDLCPGQVIRVAGINDDHASILSDCDVELPPIVVQQGTFRVIDGMHRLQAARLRGDKEIRVQLLDVGDDEAFRYGLTANIAHGLPLTLADRKAAARKLMRIHADWSDRAVGEASGLSGKTVGALRRANQESGPAQPTDRIGLDGRARPVDSAARRQTARALVAALPRATLREIAREAGISPGTVRRVRRSLAVESPDTATIPSARTGMDDSAAGRPERQPGRRPGPDSIDVDADAILERLLQDPSLKYQTRGRDLLRRLLHMRPILSQVREVMDGIPEHCVPSLALLARIYGQEWLELAGSLETPTART